MEATLNNADFSHADLHDALINDAHAPYAVFNNGCNLTGAYLWGTDFREADFRTANLTGANLRNCQLVRVKFQGATLVACKVFGVAAWDLELEGAVQRDLNVNRPDAPAVLVDDLEVAQFVYLLLDNRRLRRVIDTITSKVVLILGRFTPERKAVLDALREYLRANDHVPIVFDFSGSGEQRYNGGCHSSRPYVPFYNRRPHITKQHTEGAGGNSSQAGRPSETAHRKRCSVQHVCGLLEVPLGIAGVPIWQFG